MKFSEMLATTAGNEIISPQWKVTMGGRPLREASSAPGSE